MTWKQRIERAARNNSFAVADLRCAGDFHSCAVGEIFGDEHTYLMKNPEMVLGLAFYDAVRSDNVRLAGKIHRIINLAFVERYQPRVR